MENKPLKDNEVDVCLEGDEYLDEYLTEKVQLQLKKIVNQFSFFSIIIFTLISMYSVFKIPIDIFENEFILYLRGIIILFIVVFMILVIYKLIPIINNITKSLQQMSLFIYTLLFR
jgi:hypothetical protein